MDDPPTVLRNVVENGNHWIAFRLIGQPSTEPGKPGSPRDAVGATVWVTANGFRQRMDVIAGGSFASSPDQRPHFGLGTATTIDKLEVRWPSGHTETISPPKKVDGFYTLTENKGLSAAH